MTEKALKDIQTYEIMLNGHSTDDIKITKADNKIPFVVMILGESSTRNHMSLYGYELPTTPNLDKRYKDGELYVFQDVISPNCSTSWVMQKLLTYYNNEMNGEWYEYHSIFDILNLAGVRTGWYSNQESSGVWGNTGRVYATQCDEGRFVETRDSLSVHRSFDEALLPMAKEALSKAADRNFLVFHLMGAHVAYPHRYPSERSKFSAEDEKIHQVNEHQAGVIAQYDNAILYTDFVVNEIIRHFETEDAVIIYVSDHGEEVYNENRDFAGHNETDASRWMVEIPMVVWCSQQFKESHQDKVQAIAGAVNRSYMTDDMIHSLLDLMDIETTEYQPERSIFNERFNTERKRNLLNGKIYTKEGGLQ